MYQYRATLERIIDGDTVVMWVDLGFSLRTKQTFRLAGINAPEKRGDEKAEGIRSMHGLMVLLDGKEITVITHKIGKYGRYIAELFVDDGESVSDLMVQNGWAEYRTYSEDEDG